MVRVLDHAADLSYKLWVLVAHKELQVPPRLEIFVKFSGKSEASDS